MKKNVLTTLAVIAMTTVPFAAFAADNTTSASFKDLQTLLKQSQQQMEASANALDQAASVEAPSYIKNGTGNPNRMTTMDSSSYTTSSIILNNGKNTTTTTRNTANNYTSVLDNTDVGNVNLSSIVVDEDAETIADDSIGFSESMPVTKEASNKVAATTTSANKPAITSLSQSTIMRVPDATAIRGSEVAKWQSRYDENSQNAFDVTLNNSTYTFKLPAKTTGYNVSTSNSYSTGNGATASTFTTNVVNESIVNGQALRTTIQLKQPADAAIVLKTLQQKHFASDNELQTLFAYNEMYDGVKTDANYEYIDSKNIFIGLKSGFVSAPNGDQRPYAITIGALSDNTVVTVTVASNNESDYDLVKGTAYAVLASATAKN
ncbi:hypothetical protein RVY78_01730 [Veillonella sp. YH-vei2232]|jgi:hypothetical protein|uniref:Uncharacterized protein n=1 Tax=Veillonella absiana TaxID=3079305 RepID=A0ABU3Z871_9FIRM|nr:MULTISPECIES: hypothetical protein [unclassified Veillonella]MDV5062695.1 hypothetical protein [Veillonella sp. YH-vei2232]MDV5088104.1 hypothetical protein [Veillonella sp. YH-vei2233]NCB95183.1 hypothetical protein [Negativicutes bacterium]